MSASLVGSEMCIRDRTRWMPELPVEGLAFLFPGASGPACLPPAAPTPQVSMPWEGSAPARH
eukprot:888748-Alexandrium_andersonii.AAC.1